jgi:hypothetical protein
MSRVCAAGEYRSGKLGALTILRFPTELSGSRTRCVVAGRPKRLGKLLDFVYYDTEPMEHAGRGETLGFDQVGDANPLPRPVSKVSPDLRKRLDGVRSPFTAADSIRIKWPSPDEAEENRGAERMDLGQIARALNQRT